jgi:HD-like signal output (HDOD) protein
MLGLNTVKNLALSTAVLGSLRTGETGKTLPMDAFWTHTICAGVTAKAMAARKGVPNNLLEEYFVAGLLHDLGKIPLCARFPGEYAQALELAGLEQGPLERAEILVFGIDHGEVGRLIAEKWKLSATMVATLGFHHEPEQADGPHRELVAIVALANLYANVYEFGSAGDRYVSDHAVGYLLKTVGLSWQELADMGTTIKAEIDKAQVFLRVSRGGA